MNEIGTGVVWTVRVLAVLDLFLRRIGRPAGSRYWRLLWRVAYGTPSPWLFAGLESREHPSSDQSLHRRAPWKCLVCGRRWLPGYESVGIYMRFGYKDTAGVFHRLTSDATGVQVYTGAEPITYGWYNRGLDIWRPQYSSDRTRVCGAHSWHFQDAPASCPRSQRTADVYSWRRIVLRPERPAVIEALDYYRRWTHACARGVRRVVSKQAWAARARKVVRRVERLGR